MFDESEYVRSVWYASAFAAFIIVGIVLYRRRKSVGSRKYAVVLNQKMCTFRARVVFQPNDRFSGVMQFIRKEKNLPVTRFNQANGAADVFTPQSGSEFQVQKDIYCTLSTIENCAKKNKGRIDTNELLIESDVYTVPELIQWVKERKREFRKSQEEKHGEGRYVLDFQGKNDSGNLLFERTKFESTRTFNNTFLKHKELLLKQIDNFINNRSWFLKRGIAHKFCLLLHGGPGCGKTAVIKALANYTDRHIINVPLTRITTAQELFDVFFCTHFDVFDNGCLSRIEIPFKKRLYLLADIDEVEDVVMDRLLKDEKDKRIAESQKQMLADVGIFNMEAVDLVFGGKSDEWDKDKVTLSTLLNILDGMLELSEQLVVMSTRHPEKLDKALVRPGRVDYSMELTKCTHEMIKEGYKVFYGKTPTDGSVRNIPEYSFNPAELVATFTQIRNPSLSLSMLAKLKPVTIDDPPPDLYELLHRHINRHVQPTVPVPTSPHSSGSAKRVKFEFEVVDAKGD